ncbi:divalent cation transporter, MgtE family,Magnesium transporter mgtE,inosine 5'-monophosphate dehydrogenase,Predicted transcriptional regulator containing CBS domains,magnesium transporter,MgtE intracellular N domain [[Clostridium] sordellii]|uniref:magnesium transporter n=1 Tax=Paraclostridium sordellii TaxID=1505 RepID=UPI0005429879|nr:magnesium transporter [Paeniclostridium sordellii]CEK34768.1 divalent cation transporter, MgtE family,Magnesium transporter mgtE,inosine 5'-monophosphate dehydrogenase,Predicted transcriptional regulator containing CBS domains,magnesium transporter,MgtE intracellular N domain [[Clostridium] sordellii] [Paeniclostridium sordellii]
MDRKDEHSKDLLNQVEDLIENNKILELRELMEEYHNRDIFDILESLDEDKQIKLFEILPIDMAASILDETDSEFFKHILSKLNTEHKANILEMMSLDDMADILAELDESEREEIINLLNQEDAQDVKELLIYEEESAGGIMTTGYIAIKKDMTAKEAIAYMREQAEDAETIYYIYVVDNLEKLVGVLSLRELIIAREDIVVEDLMSENIISVYVDEDREKAVKLVSKYDLIAIPVVSRDETLKGIITVDDVIDVIEEEASEDMYKFAGTSEQERDIIEQNNVDPKDQVISSFKARIPWLVITLIGGFLATLILSSFDYVIDSKYFPLIYFVPIVTGMGGNIGTQASALTVMALSNKHLNFKNVLLEGLVGVFTGIICSLIIGIATYVFVKDINIVLIVSLSLLINMIIGAMIGSSVPMLFKKFDVDPSIVSAPLIATALDIIGMTIYFLITTIILSKIV